MRCTRSTIRSVSFLFGPLTASKKMDPSQRQIRSYEPKSPNGPFPYSSTDLTPVDPGHDSMFYDVPRFVAHIDANAINRLSAYYDQVLPRKGRILDFCSSWISHYPRSIQEAAATGSLDVLGTGMNGPELSKNPVLKHWAVQDLNEEPEVRLPGPSGGNLDASTCVVSIDYLTKPVDVLQGIRKQTKEGGKVHLIISNRCFPTKVVGRWLKVDKEQRLEMVADYLWWSGWRNIEIETLVEGTWMKDPLWVVRAENAAESV
ncbi:hypothetical protein ABEF95_009256 [Exophiala dermatitidis]